MANPVLWLLNLPFTWATVPQLWRQANISPTLIRMVTQVQSLVIEGFHYYTLWDIEPPPKYDTTWCVGLKLVATPTKHYLCIFYLGIPFKISDEQPRPYGTPPGE